MVGVALEGERSGSVPGESLEVPYRLSAARQQAQATMPQVVEPDRGQPRSVQELSSYAAPLEDPCISSSSPS